jgi:hypothetical protein
MGTASGKFLQLLAEQGVNQEETVVKWSDLRSPRLSTCTFAPVKKNFSFSGDGREFSDPTANYVRVIPRVGLTAIQL